MYLELKGYETLEESINNDDVQNHIVEWKIFDRLTVNKQYLTTVRLDGQNIDVVEYPKSFRNVLKQINLHNFLFTRQTYIITFMLSV